MIRKIRKTAHISKKNLRGGCGCGASNWLSSITTDTQNITKSPKKTHRKTSRKSTRKTSRKSTRKTSRKLMRKSQRGGFISGCQLATVTEPGFKVTGNLAAGINGLDIPESKVYISRGNCGGSGCGVEHPMTS